MTNNPYALVFVLQSGENYDIFTELARKHWNHVPTVGDSVTLAQEQPDYTVSARHFTDFGKDTGDVEVTLYLSAIVTDKNS